MGYSHFWYKKQKLDKVIFKKFSRDCRSVLENSSVALSYPVKLGPGWTDVGGFLADDDYVAFNGVGDEGRETFWFQREVAGNERNTTRAGKVFGFCRTNQKLYDAYVVACLILAKIHFKKDIEISSDGDASDWKFGMELMERHCKYSITLVFSKKLIDGGIEVLVEAPNVIESLVTPETKKRLEEDFKKTDIYELIG